MTALAKLESATRMLAECRSAKDAKQLMDLAAAAEVYAKRAKLGEQAEKYAREIKIDAMTIMGEHLEATPKAKGELKRGHETPAVPSGNHGDSLKDLGISKKESQQSQALARAKREDPEIHKAARNGDVSPAHVAGVMAQSKPMSDEELAERSRKMRERNETRYFRELVQHVLVGCETPDERQFIARHLLVEPLAFSENFPDSNFSPVTLALAGKRLVELSTEWKALLK